MQWGNQEWNRGDAKMPVSYRSDPLTLGPIAFHTRSPCISALHAEAGRGNASMGKYMFCFGKES